MKMLRLALPLMMGLGWLAAAGCEDNRAVADLGAGGEGAEFGGAGQAGGPEGSPGGASAGTSDASAGASGAAANAGGAAGTADVGGAAGAP